MAASKSNMLSLCIAAPGFKRPASNVETPSLPDSVSNAGFIRNHRLRELGIFLSILLPVVAFAQGGPAIAQTTASLGQIIAIRADLERDLAVNPKNLSPEELSDAGERIAAKARRLWDEAGLTGPLDTKPELQKAAFQAGYALAIGGTLGGPHRLQLCDIIRVWTDCRSGLSLENENNHISMETAKVEAAFENGLVGGAEAVLPFLDYTNGYNNPKLPLIEFAGRARTESGRQLAQIVLDRSGFLGPAESSYAKAVLARRFNIGQPVDIKFPALDGRIVDFADLRGKVVLVDFWATDCGPCIREIPQIKALYDQYRDRGFEVVGVTFDGSKDPVMKIIDEKKITWPNYFNSKGDESDMAISCGIVGTPEHWLVDKRGNLLGSTDIKEDFAKSLEILLSADP